MHLLVHDKITTQFTAVPIVFAACRAHTSSLPTFTPRARRVAAPRSNAFEQRRLQAGTRQRFGTLHERSLRKVDHGTRASSLGWMPSPLVRRKSCQLHAGDGRRHVSLVRHAPLSSGGPTFAERTRMTIGKCKVILWGSLRLIHCAWPPLAWQICGIGFVVALHPGRSGCGGGMRSCRCHATVTYDRSWASPLVTSVQHTSAIEVSLYHGQCGVATGGVGAASAWGHLAALNAALLAVASALCSSGAARPSHTHWTLHSCDCNDCDCVRSTWTELEHLEKRPLCQH
jgi:hypothetical protein